MRSQGWEKSGVEEKIRGWEKVKALREKSGARENSVFEDKVKV